MLEVIFIRKQNSLTSCTTYELGAMGEFTAIATAVQPGGVATAIYNDIKYITITASGKILSRLVDGISRAKMRALEELARDLIKDTIQGWDVFTESQLGLTVYRAAVFKDALQRGEYSWRSISKVTEGSNNVLADDVFPRLVPRLWPAVNMTVRMNKLDYQISSASLLNTCDMILSQAKKHIVNYIDADLRRPGIVRRNLTIISQMSAMLHNMIGVLPGELTKLDDQFEAANDGSDLNATQRMALGLAKVYYRICRTVAWLWTRLGVGSIPANEWQPSDSNRDMFYGFGKKGNNAAQFEIHVYMIAAPALSIVVRTLLERAGDLSMRNLVRDALPLSEFSKGNLFSRNRRKYTTGKSEEIDCAAYRLRDMIATKAWAAAVYDYEVDILEGSCPDISENYTNTLGFRVAHKPPLQELYSNQVLNKLSLTKKPTLDSEINRRRHAALHCGDDIIAVSPEYNCLILNLKEVGWLEVASSKMESPILSWVNESKVRRIADLMLAVEFSSEPRINNELIRQARRAGINSLFGSRWRKFARYNGGRVPEHLSAVELFADKVVTNRSELGSLMREWVHDRIGHLSSQRVFIDNKVACYFKTLYPNYTPIDKLDGLVVDVPLHMGGSLILGEAEELGTWTIPLRSGKEVYLVADSKVDWDFLNSELPRMLHLASEVKTRQQPMNGHILGHIRVKGQRRAMWRFETKLTPGGLDTISNLEYAYHYHQIAVVPGESGKYNAHHFH